ncbi:MAG: sensor histidine kinase [Bacteroides sp.]
MKLILEKNAFVFSKIILVIGFLFLIEGSIFAIPKKKYSILIVNSFSKENIHYKAVVEDLKHRIGSAMVDVEFNSINLNVRALNSFKEFNKVKEQALSRLKSVKVDLVLYLFNSSFQLLNADLFALYPETKTILFAEGQYIGTPEEYFKQTPGSPRDWTHLSKFENRKNMTIIYASPYYYYSLVMMKQIVPNLKEILYVCDHLWDNMEYTQKVQSYLTKYFPEIKLKIWSSRELTTTQLIDSISDNRPNSAVIFASWSIYRDTNKDRKYYLKLPSLISQLSPSPVFTLYDGLLDQAGLIPQAGLLGGYFPLWTDIVETIGKVCKDNLFNRHYKSQVVSIPAQPILNYAEVDRRKLDLKNLQMTPLFYNQPYSLWKEHKGLILSAGFIVILLLGYSFGRILMLRKIRIMQKGEIERMSQIMQELQLAKEKAEEANRLKSAFLANISHEIRTPLNAIVGFSDIIASGDCPEEDMDEYRHIVKTNNSLLLQLINDVLDLSVMESENNHLNIEEVRLMPIMNEVKEMFSVKLSKPLNIVFESNSPDILLSVDRGKLLQVIHNFLSNAMKFTPEGGTITYGYRTIGNQSMVRFYVADTGCGIAKEKLSQVFNRFFKVDEYTQGAGLGLAICKELVQKMGGTIGVKSELGEGTMFWFDLPIKLQA